MAWDNPINTANQAKAKACIYDNTYLNYRYLKGKRFLKMKNSS